MAKKRSKSIKKKTQARREKSLAQKTKFFAPEKKINQTSSDSTTFNQLIGYNVSLIYKDLFKSLIITVIFIAVLITVFLYT